MTKNQILKHFRDGPYKRPNVSRLCRFLGISRSLYYRWKKYPPVHHQRKVAQKYGGTVQTPDGTLLEAYES